MKVNLGCGAQVAEGWVNVDYALGARVAKLPIVGKLSRKIKVTRLEWDDRIFIHDLRKPFPWPDSSVDAVYSSHTLEHLTKDEGRCFLRESHRVLRPGGVLRIVVPDLKALVGDYVEGRLQADDFVGSLDILARPATGSLKKRLAPLFQFGHKCMYDAVRLLQLLDEAGFASSERPALNSDIEGIDLVELESRTVRAVIVEGRKR